MLSARVLAVFGLVVAFAPEPRAPSARAAQPARTVAFARAHRPESAIAPSNGSLPGRHDAAPAARRGRRVRRGA